MTATQKSIVLYDNTLYAHDSTRMTMVVLETGHSSVDQATIISHMQVR